MRRGTRLDLTTVLLVLGSALLFVVVRAPYRQAHAVADAETRRLTVARLLFDAASGAGAAALDAGTFPPTLLAEVHGRCESLQLAASAWPRPQEGSEAPGARLANDETLFLVAHTPPPPGQPPPDPPSVEVWAWPRDEASEAGAVFCLVPGRTQVTRNITHRYVGPDRAPEPGTWRARPGEGGAEHWSLDGSYWRQQP